MTRPGKTYIIQTDDGPESKNVFLTWDTDDNYYTTVESIDEINECDLHDTIESAESRARDADSSTFGGWNWAPMRIVELLNFDDVYNNGDEPDLIEIRTISFKRT